MTSEGDLSVLGAAPEITPENAAVVYGLAENRLSILRSASPKQYTYYIDSANGISTTSVTSVADIDSNFVVNLKTPQEATNGFEYKLVTTRLCVPYSWYQIDDTNRFIDWFLYDSTFLSYVTGSLTNASARIAIPTGYYATDSNLATAIKNAINAQMPVGKAFDVTYDTTTNKIKIAQTSATNGLILYLCFRKYGFPYVPTGLSPLLFINSNQRTLTNVHRVIGMSDYCDVVIADTNSGLVDMQLTSPFKYTIEQIQGTPNPSNIEYFPYILQRNPKQRVFARLTNAAFANSFNSGSSDSDNRVASLVLPSNAVVNDLLVDDQDDVINYDIITRNLSSFEVSLVDEDNAPIRLNGRHWQLTMIFEERELPFITDSSRKRQRLVSSFRSNANELRSRAVSVTDNSTAVARQVLDTDRMMATLAGIQRRLQGVPVLMPQAPALPPGPTEAAQQEVAATTSEQ